MKPLPWTSVTQAALRVAKEAEEAEKEAERPVEVAATGAKLEPPGRLQGLQALLGDVEGGGSGSDLATELMMVWCDVTAM